jgi:hypothetical protein
LFRIGDCTVHDFVEPVATSGDDVDETKARSGRVFSLRMPCGRRILRNRFDGGFCQGIDSPDARMPVIGGAVVVFNEPVCSSNVRDQCNATTGYSPLSRGSPSLIAITLVLVMPWSWIG